MAYEYKSPFIPFILLKSVFLFMAIVAALMCLMFVRDHRYVKFVVSIAATLAAIVLYWKTVRITIRSELLCVRGLFRKKCYSYSQIRCASQIAMLAPKTIMISYDSSVPFAIYLCPITYLIFIDDLLNTDIHEVVEYVNIRATAVRRN
jgi:hypothetical protein